MLRRLPDLFAVLCLLVALAGLLLWAASHWVGGVLTGVYHGRYVELASDSGQVAIVVGRHPAAAEPPDGLTWQGRLRADSDGIATPVAGGPIWVWHHFGAWCWEVPQMVNRHPAPGQPMYLPSATAAMTGDGEAAGLLTVPAVLAVQRWRERRREPAGFPVEAA